MYWSNHVFQGCALRWANGRAFGPAAHGVCRIQRAFGPNVLRRATALTLTLSRRERGPSRRGQALVEFAIVSLVVYLLLAAILTFGLWIYSAQGLQQAVDVAAREISRTPLPAAMTLSGSTSITLNYVLYGDATQDSSLLPVRQQVFDDNMLVLAIDPTPSGSNSITYNGGHAIGDFPLVTQQLMPLMINDQVNGQQLLRFPGAMFQSSQQGGTSPAGITYSGYVVRIPVVSAPTAAGTGQTIINWLSPLEPILDSQGNDSFAVNATTVSGLSGAVALRINYPYQSATMSGYVPPTNPAAPPGPPANPVVPIVAGNDSSSSPPGVGGPVVSDFQYGPYAGANGLGEQAAWTTTVRPYRSVISPQAIYRREVFQ
jgi:hypothetical protein